MAEEAVRVIEEHLRYDVDRKIPFCVLCKYALTKNVVRHLTASLFRNIRLFLRYSREFAMSMALPWWELKNVCGLSGGCQYHG